MNKNLYGLLLTMTLLACVVNRNSTPSESSGFDEQAHRGGRGLWPENTIQAMYKAIDLGVTTLEMDVYISKDKQVVVSHDAYFSADFTTTPEGGFLTRAEGYKRLLYNMNYDSIRRYDVGLKPHPYLPNQVKMAAYKPLLSELIDSVEAYAKSKKRSIHYNIEPKVEQKNEGVKHPFAKEFIDLVIPVIKEKKIDKRTIIQASDFRALRRVKEIHPSIRISLLTGVVKSTPEMQMSGLGFKPDIFSPPFAVVTKELIDAYHSQNIKVVPWTVNDILTIRKLKAMGVDGIISDYPDLLIKARSAVESDTFEALRAEFSSPDKEYGSAPLWVWHTKVTKTIIDSMMQEFKENAFGGVMVHPRPGVITEYLSEEWYDLFRYTVKKGKELGMNVWIYDENSYPTGFAGGLVPAQMPESYNQGQMLSMSKAEVLPDSTTLIFVCLSEEGGRLKNITKQIAQYKNKPGKYYLFKKEYYRKQGGMVGPPDFSYVDLMVKGVTEKFIDITFKGYEKVVGSEFGKAVPGIFSDEPSIPAQGIGNIRWTPDLFGVFKKTWGYALEDHLPSLFEETGEWRKVRHNYMQTVSQLFIDRWAKPMLDYTTKKNLTWTGHYWEHGWPDPNDVPDNMGMYAWMQQPGIDMLFNNFNEKSPNAQFGNIRAVKELSSVANQLNKKRTLSETYGGGGWELTFKDMKRLGDWQTVLGVNFMNQHLAMMTLTGARKYDYPQSFSYHTPWWPYYKDLNQYFSRLSLATSRGKQMNEILIIEPTTSAWMYVTRKERHAKLDLGARFQSFVTTLEKAHVEYDLGSENIIKDHGRIADRKFVVGERAYTTVVIPPGMENIDKPTFMLLKEYAEKGGKIVQFEQLKALDGAYTNTDLDSFNKKKVTIQCEQLDGRVILQHFRSADFGLSGQGQDSIGGNLYHQRRQFRDGQLLLLTNASMDASSKGRIDIRGKDALFLNLMSGEIMDYPESESLSGLLIDFDIPPAGSAMFFIADKKGLGKQYGLRDQVLPKSRMVVKGSEMKIHRPLENTLMIDFCDLKIGDKSWEEVHTFAAAKLAFQQYGFNKNPWDHQVQYKKRLVERDTFSVGTGFVAGYHFMVEKGVDYRRFRAAIEQGDLWNTIRINGQIVKPAKNTWWLDRSFGVLDIGRYLREGDNVLSLEVNPMRIYAEIEPVYILGDFNLESANKGWKISSPGPLGLGSWKAQGMPLYGHEVTYSRTFEIDQVTKEFELALGEWKGTVVAVSVNGQQAGIVTSEPNTLNVTKYLKNGTNLIEVKVLGSLKNLLGPHHNNPRPGMVGPYHWSNVKVYPPGNKYDTYDYGLFENFELRKLN